ncbi:hypothetical protein ACV1CU_12685, partial [Aeromonas caviae]
MMKMPNLGLGTFRLKDQPLRDSLLQGLELGYRHIDTAQIYDNWLITSCRSANNIMPITIFLPAGTAS